MFVVFDFCAFAFLCFSAPLASLFSASLIVCSIFSFLGFCLQLFPALIACCFFLVGCFPLPLLSFCFCASLLLGCSALTLCFRTITITITTAITITIVIINRITISSPTRQRKCLAKSPSKPSSKGAPSLQMGGGGPAPPQPPALLSGKEMNKHVFSNTQEGESHTKTLQGVKSEENKIIMNETSSPTDKKAKARRIRWGVKSKKTK